MYQIALLLVFLSFAAHAAPLKTVEDFYKESQTSWEKASGETDFQKKAALLKSLEKSFDIALEQYEETNPSEGDDKEQDVARLYYTLEPAFELAKLKVKNEKDCARKTQTVRSHDSMGKPEDSALSRKAKEALRWLDVLCK